MRFAAARLGRVPSDLALEDIDAALILAFLEDTEQRGACVHTRNARLAAIKAFFRFLEYRVPAALDQIPAASCHPAQEGRRGAGLLANKGRISGALLAAPDPRRREGVRGTQAMLSIAYACGLRVSELTGLRLADYDRRDPASLHVMGKGRRERILPLWKETRAALETWLRLRDPDGDEALFHNRGGRAMSRSGFEYVLGQHVVTAARKMPSIVEKRLTPHAPRHSCAMHTLQATGDVRKVSALARPCQHPEHGDLSARRSDRGSSRWSRVSPCRTETGRFHPPDKLLALLASKDRP